MKKRNLLESPCWRAEDLGQGLPDSPHAVSVALPRWEDVIAYEEKDPACIQKLRAIYPRFGLNPLVAEVANEALKDFDSRRCTGWPYPNITTAKKAKIHCDEKAPNGATTIVKALGLYCLIANERSTHAAKAFWQHTGLGASSREAAIALNKENAPSLSDGEEARKLLKQRLANIYCCPTKNIQLYPSGMASLASALEAVTQLFPKKATLQLGFPYVDVLKLPQVVFHGSDLLIDTSLPEIAKELDRKRPAAVIVELPSNPLLQCIDLIKVSKLAHERGIPVIADDTIGCALNIDSLPYADLIFSSLTKSFAGRGDILAGALVISPKSMWHKELVNVVHRTSASTLSDADAIELEGTSRDIFERLPKSNESCLDLKKRLEGHISVSKVLYPDSCPNFAAIKRNGSGYGCLLSFELVGGLTKAKKFYNSLQVCKGPSLGTNFTLVCPYVLLAHYNELPWAEKCGAPAHLIRVSVGLEKHEDLWSRFEMALQA